MKRFYSEVSIASVDGGYEVHLDGKAVRTPKRLVLRALSKDLADHIAAEWQAQGDEIIPASMPITQILSTRLDKFPAERDAATEQLLRFVDTDLLCYRADAPADLVAAQQAAWDSVLAIIEGRCGVKPMVTDGLAALQQPESLHAALTREITALDEDRFTILQLAAPLAGSVMAGLVFSWGEIDADTLFALARVEERYKDGLYDVDRYGLDPAQQAADAAVIGDLKAAEIYLSCLN